MASAGWRRPAAWARCAPPPTLGPASSLCWAAQAQAPSAAAPPIPTCARARTRTVQAAARDVEQHKPAVGRDARAGRGPGRGLETGLGGRAFGLRRRIPALPLDPTYPSHPPQKESTRAGPDSDTSGYLGWQPGRPALRVVGAGRVATQLGRGPAANGRGQRALHAWQGFARQARNALQATTSPLPFSTALTSSTQGMNR